MATIREYFLQHPGLTFDARPSLEEDGRPVESIIAALQDFEAGVKYLRIYIGPCEAPDGVFAHIFANFMDDFYKSEAAVTVTSGISGGDEAIVNSALPFTGRVMLYTDSALPKERWNYLAEQMKPVGYQLVVRDATYAKLREKYDKPIAFLSHDSRDKEAFVRPLANKLASALCPVWYDEFSLVPGQSLRASIERGIKECGKCVVILSPNFFSNTGWSAREFETIYQREILDGKRYMIPIWLNVTKQQVYDYSPILLDTYGIPSDIGVDEVARRLQSSLNYVPPERVAD